MPEIEMPSLLFISNSICICNDVQYNISEMISPAFMRDAPFSNLRTRQMFLSIVDALPCMRVGLVP